MCGSSVCLSVRDSFYVCTDTKRSHCSSLLENKRPFLMPLKEVAAAILVSSMHAEKRTVLALNIRVCLLYIIRGIIACPHKQFSAIVRMRCDLLHILPVRKNGQGAGQATYLRYRLQFIFLKF